MSKQPKRIELKELSSIIGYAAFNRVVASTASDAPLTARDLVDTVRPFLSSIDHSIKRLRTVIANEKNKDRQKGMAIALSEIITSIQAEAEFTAPKSGPGTRPKKKR